MTPKQPTLERLARTQSHMLEAKGKGGLGKSSGRARPHGEVGFREALEGAGAHDARGPNGLGHAASEFLDGPQIVPHYYPR